ncbi:MAG: hypothetical protein GEU90_04835 [Gemmatimonas sp.]|nr:hypothetical protein [Gemmatimonas sp.]
MTLVRGAIALIIAVSVGWACAHVEAPPGGPDDTTPPEILTTRPQADTIAPGYRDPVVLVFTERISERSIVDAVTVSPRTSPVSVDIGRDEIRVSLRQGWSPGAIYHVGVGQNVEDLFGNRLAEPIRFVFSTGPEIPETALSGTVIDRITGLPDTDVRVEAIRTDSLVYATLPDTAGAFLIAQFPEGEYEVRAYRDLNRNRAFDPFEAGDSAAVEVRVDEPADVALRVLEPDSTAPVAGAVQLVGDVVQVEFDDYLDPDQAIDPSQVAVTDSTGATVPIDTVAVGELLPTEPDSLAALPDTAQTPAPAAPPAAAQQPPEPGATPETPDNLPSRTLAVRLADEADLMPGAEYTVSVDGVTNLVGLTGGGESSFTAPEESPEPAQGQSDAPPQAQ